MNDPQFDVGQKPHDAAYHPDEAGFTPEPPPKKKHGCFFYGCIIAIILAVLALICIGAIVYVGYNWYSRMLMEWTGTAPVPIPSVTLAEEERKALDDRIAAFKKALDDGQAAELILTADEINAEIAKTKELSGKVFVKINGDEITADVSVPLGETGFPGTKGRYFNGSGTFNITVEDGEIVVIARELEANGKKLPAEAKQQLAKQNLAQNFNPDPETYKYIRKFESIKIKDGKVYIKAKVKHKEESEDEAKTKGDEADKDARKDAGKSAEPAKDKEATKSSDVGKDVPTPKDAPKEKDEPKGRDAPAPVPAPKAGELPKKAA
jgi:hypothetical protein